MGTCPLKKKSISPSMVMSLGPQLRLPFSFFCLCPPSVPFPTYSPPVPKPLTSHSRSTSGQKKLLYEGHYFILTSHLVWASVISFALSPRILRTGPGDQKRRTERQREMESSEEEDDFPMHEWITPQSHIHSLYQSHTEKGIRKLCSELLDLKEAVENLSGNMHTKYLSFLRISEEVSEMEQELNELRKHVSSQRVLVQDLMSGVCHELEEWNKASSFGVDDGGEFQTYNVDDILRDETEDPKLAFLETIDVLLAEHRVDDALLAVEKEDGSLSDLNVSEDSLPIEDSSYKVAFLKRKEMLVEQLVEITEQPFVGNEDLKKALSGLVELGKGPLAHKLLLKAFSSRLKKNIETILPSCSIYSETYTATLSQLVFSTISLASKESCLMFGDAPAYENRIVSWAECEIESFVRLVKEYASLSETATALCSASICLQASLDYCSCLESQGLKFSKLLMVLLHPYVEEVLDMNFKRARRKVLDMSGNDDGILLSPQLCLPLSAAATSNFILANSGKKFMSIVVDILERLTPMVFLHFGVTILNWIHALFDRYVESLIKALPGSSEDENITDQKEGMDFRVETDAQQLALLGTAYTVADELLPLAVSRLVALQCESKESGNAPPKNVDPVPISTVEFKEWRRQLLRVVDKLRDHFCRQYVLTFIYSREDEARLEAHMYLKSRSEDIFWDSDPLPSLPFQALFARLHQLATVVGDVLLGKEKLQKGLLSRLTETVVIWLSNEQGFWDVLEGAAKLPPSGLQQLILDMHFIVEITIFGGYPSKNLQQTVPAIFTRAIEIFSKKGVDPQSALPEYEWFVDAAKSAINKLLLRTSGYELSEMDNEHILLHDDVSQSDETISSPLSVHSTDSFASANMGETSSPIYFTDPES